MPLVIGVDSSTSGTKVVLVDSTDGTTLASSSSPHPPTTPPRSEQPPTAWWAALETSTQHLPANKRATTGVAAIAVAGQQHGLVALDSPGGRCGRPSCGTTPKRPRMGIGWSSVSAEPASGSRRAEVCHSPRSRSRSSRGFVGSSRTCSRNWGRWPSRTTGSRCSSPAGWSLIVVTPPAPVTGHRAKTAGARPPRVDRPATRLGCCAS